MKKCKKCGEIMEDIIGACEHCLCPDFIEIKEAEKKEKRKKKGK